MAEEESKDIDADQNERILNDIKALPWSQFMAHELMRGFAPEYHSESYASRLQRVQTFMKTPRELEKTLAIGFLLCLDSFLFIFTLLPIRIVMALMHFCRKFTLHPHQICDILRGLVFLICCVFIRNLDISVIYHVVRGQSVIKLYVIYNILDILDKLFASFGQDILDTLFWTTTQFKKKNATLFQIFQYFFLSVLYVFLHTILVLVQSVALNVAVNSHSKALLTIIVSNQFVELKGSVFKRFDRFNLFQMSCADARERFQNFVLIGIVCLRNLTQYAYSADYLWEILPDFLMVMVSEVLVDWVKHAFITKFNNISAEVYLDYREALAKDVAVSRRLDSHSHHSDLICRRMGLTPLPIGCLIYRVLAQSVTLTGKFDIFIAIGVYLMLILTKMVNSKFILAKAVHYLRRANERRSKADNRNAKAERHDSVSAPYDRNSNKKDVSSSPDTELRQRSKIVASLDKIDRYTLCSNRIV